jgi:hypothetical protein
VKSFVILLVLFIGSLGLLFYWFTSTPGVPQEGPLPALAEDELGMQTRLEDVCTSLARDIGPRGGHRGGAPDRSEDYLEGQLRRTGLTVEDHTLDCNGVVVHNYTVQIDGGHAAGEIVLIGAHYDTANQSPGADGDASGCAAVIELAHALRGLPFDRTIRFALFGHGAEPFAGTTDAGSYHYARECREHHEKIVAMIALDGLGCFKDTPGSQSVPFPFNFYYPDTANFVAFVGNFDSRDLLQKSVEVFRAAEPFPAYGVCVPGFMPGATDSDQYGFWNMDFPALVVTDTGSLRSKEYQHMADTVDRLDFPRMARVTNGLAKVITALATRSASLH